MEIVKTTTRTIHNVEAEEYGWRLVATISMRDGKVQSIDGNAYADNKAVNFNGYRGEDGFVRNIFNVTDGNDGAYAVICDLISSAIAQFEAE